MAPSLWLATLLLLLTGSQGANAESCGPSSTITGACCTASDCTDGETVSTCAQKQGLYFAPETTCTAKPCARGTCCKLRTKVDDPTFKLTNSFKHQCLVGPFGNQNQPNQTNFQFLKGVTSLAACNQLKGACCVRQADGNRMCQRLGFKKCSASAGFITFNYNKTCAEAKCWSGRIGACCAADTDGRPPQLCTKELSREECSKDLYTEFVPKQACAADSCGNFTGGCCYVSSDGKRKCDDTLTLKACRALPGYTGFNFGRTCADANCAKYGACCNMDATRQGKAPTCTPGQTEEACVSSPQKMKGPLSAVWVGGAACSACQGPLPGACCMGSANGTTTCQSNVQYKDCIIKPGYLAFSGGKDCQKDKVDCSMYGACCLPEDCKSRSYYCLGYKDFPHQTEPNCLRRSYFFPPDVPLTLWKKGVPCLDSGKCPPTP